MTTFSTPLQGSLTVSELTIAIKNTLDKTFTHIAVRGEIVNIKLQSSGHCYFTLKDTTSQISCVIFHRYYSSLCQEPKSGDAVTVYGNLSIYAPRGTYQIIVNKVEFSGSGALLLRLHQVKIKLQKLGWFEESQKQAIPTVPKTIAILTSPTGAVIQDILHILSHKLRGFHIIINPILVQGELAAHQIVTAIRECNQFSIADVLILARGGGSLEDLWPFNEECVAEAIRESKIPIISAVGHETDYSISDFVADLRCPTPSAAASLIANSIITREQQVETIGQKIDTAILQKIRIASSSLSGLTKHSVLQNPYLLLSLPLQKFDYLLQSSGMAIASILEKKRVALQICRATMERVSPSHLVEIHRMRIENFRSQIDKAITIYWKQQKEKGEHIRNQLDNLNPTAILKRGYCIPFAENSASIIMESQSLCPLDTLQLLFHDGTVTTTVVQIKEKKYESP